MIVTILALSMIVLMVAFRSVLVPLQAALTNLITALASFGVLTALSNGDGASTSLGVATNDSSCRSRATCR